MPPGFNILWNGEVQFIIDTLLESADDDVVANESVHSDILSPSEEERPPKGLDAWV